MKHYLYEFQDLAAYNAAKATLEKPSASYLIGPRSVIYDPYVPMAVVGDYLYSDLTFSSTLNQGKTAIGLCVAPASHFQNAKARWMSLVNMSATDPEHGTIATGDDSYTNPGAGFCWGASGSIIGLTESTEAPTLVCNGINQPTSKLSDSPASRGYVPSDHFNSETIETPVTYPLNSSYSYCGDGEEMGGYDYGAIPSPFNPDGSLNSWARLYALQYESGKSQTAAIMAGASEYLTGVITRYDCSKGSYPAAIACSRFYTSGTQVGDWYLPSISELMYIAINLDLINSKLDNLGNAAVKVGDSLTYDSDGLGAGLWSSSVFSDDVAWGLVTDGCYVGDYNRDSNLGGGYRVRAFLEL